MQEKQKDHLVPLEDFSLPSEVKMKDSKDLSHLSDSGPEVSTLDQIQLGCAQKWRPLRP